MKKLAIKTPDNRLLFTNLNNLHCILEYAKTISAELYIAKCNKELSLDQLANALCGNSINQSNEDYILLKPIYPVFAPKKKNAISTFINNRLIENKSISISDIKTKFPDSQSSAISYYLSKTIKDLEKTGLKTKRIKRGVYEIK